MKKSKHRWLPIVAALLIALGCFPFTASADTEALPNQGDNGKMWYKTDIGSAFNIKGYVGPSLYQTTYGDGGYNTVLNDGGTYYYLTAVQNGVEAVYGNFGVTMKLEFVSSGYYVKVQYLVRNLTAQQQTFSLGTCSDTQIGGNDYAPLEIIDNSTLVMRDGGTAQFNIVGRNAYGVTDVSTFWIGHYSGQITNIFNNGPTSLSGTDSGLAYSWKDIVIAPGETKTMAVLFGVGPVNYAPTVALGTVPSEIKLSEDLSLGGTVTDTENSTGTKLYYVLDEGTPVLFHTFADIPGAFNYTLDLPSTQSFLGAHKVTVFAEDSDGAISQSVVKDFTVVMPQLTGIAVATPPLKLNYNVGEALNFAGLTVNMVYENGMTLPLEEFALSVPDGTAVVQGGRYPVQITYTDGRVTYQAAFYYNVAEEFALPDTGDEGIYGMMALAAFMSLMGMTILVRRRTNV